MNATTSTAIIVHGDDKQQGSSSASSGVVLDALPYVEPLDPNYEQYAISLIEEELHHVVTEQQQQQLEAGNQRGGQELSEHPSLQRLLPASANFSVGTDDISMQTPDFGGKAPMAMAAYEVIAAKRANNEEAPTTTPFTINRPDPMAEGNNNNNVDKQTQLSNLQTSIATSKIQLEQERLRFINLELHQNFETPARYTAYATQLETQYLNPTSRAVEDQRRTVDGINATRMEEQTQSIGKLEGMAHKWEILVDKNRRLGLALEGLEREVKSLRGDCGNGEERGEASMNVAEGTKEN